MNVVDSSGWLEYFTGGSNADFFETPIVDEENLIVPTVCIYEVFKKTLQRASEDDALNVAGEMSLGVVADLNREIAMNAARISIELKLAMADSLILATARTYNATLWTQDEHFKDLPGVQYVEKRVE